MVLEANIKQRNAEKKFNETNSKVRCVFWKYIHALAKILLVMFFVNTV